MSVQRPQYSLEFFPPRTDDGVAKLRAARVEFARLRPAFCSVTFGAGGSTREGTLATVLEIRADGMEGAPHISCIGSTRDGIHDVLDQYRRHGIRHLAAPIRAEERTRAVRRLGRRRGLRGRLGLGRLC